MRLTPKQEKFCVSYLETGNATEAYRQSYNTGKMGEASINVAASRLLANAKIALRLEELRKPVIEAAQYTLQQHLDRLAELSRKAEEAEQYSAAITAETNRGKAAGHYVERMEHSGPDGGPIPSMPSMIQLVAPDDCGKD